jgi:hypothetical protein
MARRGNAMVFRWKDSPSGPDIPERLNIISERLNIEVISNVAGVLLNYGAGGCDRPYRD